MKTYGTNRGSTTVSPNVMLSEPQLASTALNQVAIDAVHADVHKVVMLF
jgi:hypothetical protein